MRKSIRKRFLTSQIICKHHITHNKRRFLTCTTNRLCHRSNSGRSILRTTCHSSTRRARIQHGHCRDGRCDRYASEQGRIDVEIEVHHNEKVFDTKKVVVEKEYDDEGSRCVCFTQNQPYVFIKTKTLSQASE